MTDQEIYREEYHKIYSFLMEAADDLKNITAAAEIRMSIIKMNLRVKNPDEQILNEWIAIKEDI